uniref:DASH complex subunit DAD1 n=1 Tax=Peronospora matthiolae TaxID=2874970 RepID=A0AAV1TQV5_9STRA
MSTESVVNEGSGEPGTSRDTESDVIERQGEQERGREEYLEGVERRIEAYENCAAALAAVTTCLEGLSGHLNAMQEATHQLNAFTSGWLAVWKRPSS